jgi:hypothetical protein
LLIVSLFASYVTQIGYAPGGWDYKFDVKRFDEYRAQEIETAVLYFILESSCENFNDLYDSTGVKPLKIKQDDPGSVKTLISALQYGVYYRKLNMAPICQIEAV